MVDDLGYKPEELSPVHAEIAPLMAHWADDFTPAQLVPATAAHPAPITLESVPFPTTSVLAAPSAPTAALVAASAPIAAAPTPVESAPVAAIAPAVAPGEPAPVAPSAPAPTAEVAAPAPAPQQATSSEPVRTGGGDGGKEGRWLRGALSFVRGLAQGRPRSPGATGKPPQED